MNWKIARIEISSFKAFKHIILDLGTTSLVTLDGPNGYGKTSIFDAIELLLTGNIKRIQNLFNILMINRQINYKDNLFWNIRSSKKDLSIKVEFLDDKRSLVLARHASVKTFDIKANNKADQFQYFSLYELPNFDSEAYTEFNKRDDQFLDEIFGKNFRENFSFLNYLEQGLNALLHTRIDDRRAKLANLFNIMDVRNEIENCQTIERKLTKCLNDKERKTRLQVLDTECSTLRNMIQTDLKGVEYKKLSTTEFEPSWDKEELFPVYDQSIHQQYLDSIERLNWLLSNKTAIRIRAENESIEADVHKNMDSLKFLAKLGKDINKLDELDIIKKEIDQLTNAITIIKKGVLFISVEQASSLPGWKPEQFERFEKQIAKRNHLQTKNANNNSAAAELSRLKQQLIAEHAKLYPDDPLCPLCGNDWKSHELMLEAVEDRIHIITNALDEDSKALITLLSSMTTELATIENHIQRCEAVLKPQYNNALHNVLKEAKTRLPLIQQLAERLASTGTQITYSFNDDEAVIEPRLEELLKSMRGKKTDEMIELPKDWRQTINETFKDLQDFFILEPHELKNKSFYIKLKANEAQNKRLQKSSEELKKIQRENNAIATAKDKVCNLRNTLEKTERMYTNQTISEIELIFHIYSGRLIQNYQRGLGLFVDSDNGKQLKFLTAEKSEHDALMSMSSGQVSALGLAFFLSLNKVYADIPIILIDDPSQSLDEVNIASLTDLLRCELKHCQLILSSHEEDISAYMRYRFERAGLTTKSLNIQRLAKEANNSHLATLQK